MPRPKRTSTTEKPNYAEQDVSFMDHEGEEEDEIRSEGEQVREEQVNGDKNVGDGLADALTGLEEQKGAVGDKSNETDEGQQQEVQRKKDRTSTTSPNSDQDGGEFIPELNNAADDDEEEQEAEKDIKPVIKKAPTSPGKRKATSAPGGGRASPTKAAKVVKKSGSPLASPNGGSSSALTGTAGGGGKFVPTPENRSAILQEMLKQVSASRMDWAAVAQVTGDQPGKLSKYYGQTFRKHLEAAVASTGFGAGAVKK